MAATPKVLARVAAATSNTTLYTVPNTTTTTIISNVVINNSSTSSSTVTLNIDSIPVMSSVSVGANTTTFVDLKQVIPASGTPKIVSGSASTTAVYFHISGVELV